MSIEKGNPSAEEMDIPRQEQEQLEIKSLSEGLEGKRTESETVPEEFTIEGENGQLLFERRRGFDDPNNPKENELKYDYEKLFNYDDEGNPIEEHGQDMQAIKQGNAWKISKELDNESKSTKESGEITKGPDQGHRWGKHLSYQTLDDGTKVKRIDGIIIEQGKNINKEVTGHKWTEIWETDLAGNTTYGGSKENETWKDWNKLKSV